MKIQELLLELGMLPAPSSGNTPPTLGQKYSGVIDPNHPLANAKSRLVSTNPKDIAAAKAAKDASSVSKFQSYSSSGTQQQQAKKGDFKFQGGNQQDITDVDFTDVTDKKAPQTTAQQATAQQAPSPQVDTPKKYNRPLDPSILATKMTAKTAPKSAPSAPKGGGFFSGVAQGFKRGMGMDPTASLASNLTQAGLNKLGMNATADAVGQNSSSTVGRTKTSTTPTGTNTEPQNPLQNIRPGQSIKDPITGRGLVKVLPNPGQKTIKLDTTKTLGYPITVDPKDLA